ncbi:MAG: hypothetical protein F4X92_03630 [Gammaproteobacteria bacterium]|nr:hypothetical protein [Gammaproteobacteria bacterium]
MQHRQTEPSVSACPSRSRGESRTDRHRLAKYNRLIRIEERLGGSACYTGGGVFAR